MQSIRSRLRSISVLGSLVLAAPFSVSYGQAPPSPGPQSAPVDTVVVTGSRIRQNPLQSSVPIEVFEPEDLRRNGVSSPEQFIATLSTNGNSADNLASQSDVAVEADQRNVNGFSGANLRGQGASSTLVLVNGRRVATHGLSGSAVDVNQVPLAAVKQIDVLKDGASAVYGTDAIGGVINFILKDNFEGVSASAFTDIAEEGGGNIYQGQLTAGYGSLDKQNFNIMGAVSYRKNEILEASDRDWINTHQPDRGLAVDTRGTPYGTIFPQAGTIFPNAASTPLIPGTTVRASGGLNPLAVAGGPGCEAGPNMIPYDAGLWSNPTAALACAYDTGRAVVIQQPQETLTYVARGVANVSNHQFALEYIGSTANAARRFSEIQLFPSTNAVLNFDYTRNAQNAAAYDDMFNRLLSSGAVTESLRGRPVAYRWRCLECGPRVIETDTDTGRALVTAQGPLPFLADWEYDAGFSFGFSESTSLTAGGYYYRATDAANGIVGIRNVLRTGLINPFLAPGQSQSADALALIRSAEARGVNIASGRSELQQLDFSVNGPLLELPAGTVQAAFGVDLRTETYDFEGEKRTNPAIIEGAPIDSKPQLRDVERDVTAIYAELLVPVFDGFEVSLAVRRDEYSGFGDTTNPKVSVRYSPWESLTFRGSYNTSFRAPTFTDLFDPISRSQVFEPFADPSICPHALPTAAIAGCVDLANSATDPSGRGRILEQIVGGKADLQPEEADQLSFGFVLEPLENYSLSIDWWRIERTNLIINIARSELVRNYSLFTDRFIRDTDNRIIAIDQRRVNAGGSLTEGLEIAGRGTHDLANGSSLSFGADISILTNRNDKILPNQPYGPSLLGKWTPARDLSLRWRHNLYATWTNEPFTVSLSQIYRSGYLDQVLPGVASGVVDPPNDDAKTEDYIIYNLTGSYSVSDNVMINVGIRNLFNTDPPFARSYLSQTGGGANWEPRVADPRGRSFTFEVSYKY